MVKANTEAEQKNNTVDIINEKIDKLIADKRKELNGILDQIEKLKSDSKKYAADLRESTEVTDLQAYKKAKEQKKEADIAIEMYNARYIQLKGNKYVTEIESDRTIDELLDYESILTSEYEKQIRHMIEQISKINAEYRDEITRAENTIRRWEHEIHANYISRSGTTYQNGEERSNRSPKPIPVRDMLYFGCPISDMVTTFLKNTLDM